MIEIVWPVRPQIFTKTRKNQLRAEYPLSIMGAIENEAALAQKEGRPFKAPVTIPKDLYPLPSLAQVCVYRFRLNFMVLPAIVRLTNYIMFRSRRE
jgi:hypothetical protein